MEIFHLLTFKFIEKPLELLCYDYSFSSQISLSLNKTFEFEIKHGHLNDENEYKICALLPHTYLQCKGVFK